MQLRSHPPLSLGATFALLSACSGALPPPRPASAPPPVASPPPAPARANAAPSQAPASAEIGAKVDAVFASVPAFADPAAHAPGCAAAVLRAGQVLFAKGYGLANLENDVPITPSTAFEIGSMSKQFTATAILLLAQDGKLSLSDDVRKYIPELPSYGKPITLRHLLHHTGGLREYDQLLSLSGWDDADVATEAEALRLVSLQRGTNFPAGTEWSYSNTGYFLLSIVVKRVSGKSLADFSKERIFAPLGMNDTVIQEDHTKVVRHHATGYSPREAGGFQVNISFREMTGEGNVQSTLADLARWDGNFYDPKVGGRAWLDTMRTPGKRDDGTALTYAMGLELGTKHGLAEEEHSGGWAGYVADWRRYPTAKLSFVCLCNRDDVNPVGLTDAMAAAILPAETSGDAPTGPTAPATASNKAAAPPSASDLAPLAGAYLEPGSLAVRTFAVKDGALEMGFGLGSAERPPVAMEAIDARSFHAPGSRSRWTFAPAAGKTPARVTRVAPGEKAMTFERFEPQAASASTLAAYVGRYESPEMTLDFEVTVDNGKLVAGPWGRAHEAVKLEPLSRDVFAGPFGFVFGRDAKGRVATMTAVFGGYRAVRWTKR